MAKFARISIEGWSFEDDERFDLLAIHLGMGIGDRDRALIRCARLWAWQTENFKPESPTYVVDRLTVDVLMGMHGAADALVKARLAEDHPDGIRVKGAKGRIEWLYNNRQNALAGGRSRQQSAARGGPKRSVDYKENPPGHPTGEPPGRPTGSHSEICDLRSGDLISDPPGDLRPSGEPTPSGDQEHVPALIAPESPSAALQAFQAIAEPKAKRARKSKAERVHERAWKAADYFRDLVLEEQPDNQVGKVAWSGDDGRRLEWAYTLHLLVTKDGRTFEQIAELLRWVFREQPASRYRFVVLSPDALRDKWDRIVSAIKNKSLPDRERRGSEWTVEDQLKRVHQLEEEERAERQEP